MGRNNHYHNHHCHHHDSDGMGCLVAILLGIFALPFVGLSLMSHQNSDDQAVGVVLLIVGVIIWIMIACNS